MTFRIHFFQFSPLEREECDLARASSHRGPALPAPVSTGGTRG